MVDIRQELLKFPEYQRVDLSRYSDSTLFTHFVASRPTSAMDFIVRNESEFGFGFGDILSLGKKVLGVVGGAVKKVFKKTKVKIEVKEPKPKAITAPTVASSPLLTQKKSNLIMYVAGGVVLLLLILLFTQKR